MSLPWWPLKKQGHQEAGRRVDQTPESGIDLVMAVWAGDLVCNVCGWVL